MEVQFTPEQQDRLTQIARRSGVEAGQLVHDIILRHLEAESRFLAAVEKGIAAADRGEFLDEVDMDARLEAILKP